MRIEGRRLPAGQRASLKSAQLEVVLDLAGADALGELSASTRHGIWALRDEANGGARTHPLGFTAIAANAANCTVRLEEIAGEHDVHRRALRAGCYGTFRWSWTQNALLLQHQSALMMLDALRDLAAGRPVAKACEVGTTPAASQARVQSLAQPPRF